MGVQIRSATRSVPLVSRVASCHALPCKILYAASREVILNGSQINRGQSFTLFASPRNRRLYNPGTAVKFTKSESAGKL